MNFGALADGWQLVIGSSLLSTLGVYLLARFTNAFDSYAGERAKLRARFEGLDELVQEAKALTQAAEVIKARVGDQVWDRQIRWSYKKDVYVNSLQALGKIRTGLARLGNAFQAEQQGRDWARDEANTAREFTTGANIDLLLQFDVAPIVLSPRAYEALRNAVRLLAAGFGASEQETRAKIAELNQALTLLTEEAKTDLGYVTVTAAV